MKHLYIGALNELNRRVIQCGTALQAVSDEYSVTYWQLELAKANHIKSRIHKRLKIEHNVITIDFRSKKRVA